MLKTTHIHSKIAIYHAVHTESHSGLDFNSTQRLRKLMANAEVTKKTLLFEQECHYGP